MLGGVHSNGNSRQYWLGDGQEVRISESKLQRTGILWGG